MRLVLRIDASSARRWHLHLLERLGAIPGLQPSVELTDKGVVGHAHVANLLRFQQRLHGVDGQGPFAALPASALDAWRQPAAGEPDLILDLGGGEAAGHPRRWRLLFDGQAGDAALIASLMASRAPLVEVVEGTEVVAAGRLGTEHGNVMLAALADILDRLVTLIAVAVTGGSPRVPVLPDEIPVAPLPPPHGGVARVMAREWMGAAAGRVYRRLFHTPHWRIGWRKLDGPDLFELRRHPEGGWRDIPDDGERFYADPFPILHDGRVTLFVEDYAHATGKGIISAVAFGADGPLGTPQPVLEQPGHLSYPFIFERDGAVWMIPESCSAGRVDLFRATAFPGGWVREATLIEGVVASDATIIERDGLWWLFATVRDGGGAYSDALCLWSAPDFRGPWTAHPRNPVLIDIASARPAGRMVVRDGELLRPVQDCRRGYGRALGIARVTRLDPDGFDQEVETIISAGPLWPGRKLHSLNSAGGFEFIDGSGIARRRLF